jgi:predicted choloylglycine hydrolase
MDIVFEAIAEDRPGAKWRQVFARHWHGYSRWFLRDGVRARPTYLAGLRALRSHMPELVPAYEAVCEAAGGGDLEARFLSMWCPPAYVGGCSQLLLTGDQPALIRNYDFSPRLLEGIWLCSRYCGKRVIAISDCLWGALDGINEDGLAVSLSFGGRRAAGKGFGIPMVLRYVLETAATAAEAVAILERVPVHMAYSVAVIDRGGRHATVFVGPDRKTEVLDHRVSTNHQHKVEWARHAEATRSVERRSVLEEAVSTSAEDAVTTFLMPPVYQTNFARGYGTLYTAFYRPEECSAELIWPGQRWRQSCGLFHEGVRRVHYATSAEAGPAVPVGWTVTSGEAL